MRSETAKWLRAASGANWHRVFMPASNGTPVDSGARLRIVANEAVILRWPGRGVFRITRITDDPLPVDYAVGWLALGWEFDPSLPWISESV